MFTVNSPISDNEPRPPSCKTVCHHHSHLLIFSSVPKLCAVWCQIVKFLLKTVTKNNCSFCHYILTAQKNNVSLDLCKIQWLFNTCAHFCAAQQTSILQFVKFSSGARNSFATLPHRCVLCVVADGTNLKSSPITFNQECRLCPGRWSLATIYIFIAKFPSGAQPSPPRLAPDYGLCGSDSL